MEPVESVSITSFLIKRPQGEGWTKNGKGWMGVSVHFNYSSCVSFNFISLCFLSKTAVTPSRRILLMNIHTHLLFDSVSYAQVSNLVSTVLNCETVLDFKYLTVFLMRLCTQEAFFTTHNQIIMNSRSRRITVRCFRDVLFWFHIMCFCSHFHTSVPVLSPPCPAIGVLPKCPVLAHRCVCCFFISTQSPNPKL